MSRATILLAEITVLIQIIIIIIVIVIITFWRTYFKAAEISLS